MFTLIGFITVQDVCSIVKVTEPSPKDVEERNEQNETSWLTWPLISLEDYKNHQRIDQGSCYTENDTRMIKYAV